MSHNRLVTYRYRLCTLAKEMQMCEGPTRLLYRRLGHDWLWLAILHRRRVKVSPHRGRATGSSMGSRKKGYYTLGSDKLIILVDHKPLLGLLPTREQGDIKNPRLMHLAERLLPWRFTIQHIAGTKIFGPDTVSRSPAQKSKVPYISSLSFIDRESAEGSDHLEGQVRAAATTRRVLITSWESIKTARISDQLYSDLLHVLQSDHDEQLLDGELAEYKRGEGGFS